MTTTNHLGPLSEPAILTSVVIASNSTDSKDIASVAPSDLERKTSHPNAQVNQPWSLPATALVGNLPEGLASSTSGFSPPVVPGRTKVAHGNHSVAHASDKRSLKTTRKSHPRHPVVQIHQTLDQIATLWETYNNMADLEDKEFVKGASADLDVLLIFAGIFAAINAAFIIETLTSLKPDSADKTNTLLMAIALGDPKYTREAVALVTGYTPSSHDITTNFIFFFSLCTSLACTFFAVMGKQWLSHFEHEESLKPPAERARERQTKLDGREKYHLQGTIESLPGLLQISLLVFLAGLVHLLWPRDMCVASCVMAFTALIFAVWGILTGIAVLNQKFPYQTHLSVSVPTLVHHIKRLQRPNDPKNESTQPMDTILATDLRIIGQILKNTVLTDCNRLNLLVNCFETISHNPRADLSELARLTIRFHLEPMITEMMNADEFLTLPSRVELQSLSMLNITRLLLSSPSAKLEPYERKAIVARMWLMFWNDPMDPTRASLTADIIVSESKDVTEVLNERAPGWEKWGQEHRSKSGMGAMLASRLRRRLQSADTDEGVSKACLSLFYACLPKGYSADKGFNQMIRSLTVLFDSKDPTRLRGLADATVSFWTGSLLIDPLIIRFLANPMAPGWHGTIHALPNQSPGQAAPEELQSTPMLKILNTLLKRSNALISSDRKTILLRLWLAFWQDGSMEAERAKLVVNSITSYTAEVVEMLTECDQSWSGWWRSGEVKLAVDLVGSRRMASFRLLPHIVGRLADKGISHKEAISCLELIFALLSRQDWYGLLPALNIDENPGQDSTRIPGDLDGCYLLGLRVILDHLWTESTAKGAPLNVLLEDLPKHLSRLCEIVSCDSRSMAEPSQSSSALDIFMAIRHYYLSTSVTDREHFDAPIWRSAIYSLLQQNPARPCLFDFPLQSTSSAAHIANGISLLIERLFSYILHTFQSNPSVSSSDMLSIKNGCQKWSQFLSQGIPQALNPSNQIESLVRKLDEEIKMRSEEESAIADGRTAPGRVTKPMSELHSAAPGSVETSIRESPSRNQSVQSSRQDSGSSESREGTSNRQPYGRLGGAGPSYRTSPSSSLQRQSPSFQFQAARHPVREFEPHSLHSPYTLSGFTPTQSVESTASLPSAHHKESQAGAPSGNATEAQGRDPTDAGQDLALVVDLTSDSSYPDLDTTRSNHRIRSENLPERLTTAPLLEPATALEIVPSSPSLTSVTLPSPPENPNAHLLTHKERSEASSSITVTPAHQLDAFTSCPVSIPPIAHPHHRL